MPPHSYPFRTPPHPLLQAVYFVIGGVVLIGAVLMGAVILAIALGLAVVIGVVAWIRFWWLKRRTARSAPPPATQGELLEVEYSVLDERDERDERDSRGS
jgi:hypothetical protein